jgi:hypothetical protein
VPGAPPAPSSASFVFGDRKYTSRNYFSVLDYANWVQGEQLRSFFIDQSGHSGFYYIFIKINGLDIF